MSNLILVDHFVFLHLLDGNYLSCLAISADTHLAKSTSSNDFERFKVTHSDFGTGHAVQFSLFVLNFLLNKFFLLLAQVHLFHLNHELVPGLFLFHLLSLLLRILGLDVGLDTLSTLFRAVRWFDLRPRLRLLLLLLVLLFLPLLG